MGAVNISGSLQNSFRCRSAVGLWFLSVTGSIGPGGRQHRPRPAPAASFRSPPTIPHLPACLRRRFCFLPAAQLSASGSRLLSAVLSQAVPRIDAFHEIEDARDSAPTCLPSPALFWSTALYPRCLLSRNMVADLERRARLQLRSSRRSFLASSSTRSFLPALRHPLSLRLFGVP